MNPSRPSLIRFSLRTLLVLMMLLCIALATTVSASPRVLRIMNWIVVFAPLLGAFMAACSRRRWFKVFWIGFAAVGLWTYTTTDHAPNRFGTYTRRLMELLRSPLVEMHHARLELSAEVVLQEDKRQRFAGLTRKELKTDYPSNWSYVMGNVEDELLRRARGIFEQNLLLAVAILCGMALAALDQWRHRRGWHTVGSHWLRG